MVDVGGSNGGLGEEVGEWRDIEKGDMGRFWKEVGRGWGEEMGEEIGK